MAGPGSAAKAKKARRGLRPDLYGGCGSRVSACDPLPFLLPFWLWTLHNTLYLSSTASPSSLLSSRPPRQHRRRWSPSCCAGRVARAIREVKPRPARAPTRAARLRSRLRKYGSAGRRGLES